MVDFLVLIGIVLVLTLAVYLLAILSTKEKSFEDALKEQKQKFEQEQAQQKADKQHKKNKTKKLNKPKKDEVDTGQSNMFSRIEQQQAMEQPIEQIKTEVYMQEPIETVTEPAPTPAQPSPVVTQAKKKAKKQKPEPEVEKIAVEEEVIEKSTENNFSAVLPPVNIKEEKPIEKKEPKKEKKVIEEPVEEEIQEKIEDITPSVSSAKTAVVEKKQKKEKEVKKEKVKAIPTEVTSQKLLQLVAKAHLTGTEIQSLIDSLLQLAGSKGGEWQEKGRMDPALQLKKQVEEIESHLKDSQSSNSALSSKITELRSELNVEKSRNSTLARQLDSFNVAQQKRIDVITASARDRQNAALNELRMTLEKEFQVKLQQQKQAISEEQVQTQIQQIKFDADLRVTTLQQELEELNQRCQNYQSTLEEKCAADNAKDFTITELQKQIAASEMTLKKITGERDQLSIQVTHFNQDISRDQLSLTKTQHSLQESLREKTELENRLSQLEADLKSKVQLIHEQHSQIECLKEEKESLASQSVRPAAEGQENGDVHLEQKQNTENIIDTNQLHSIVKEKDTIIDEQSHELAKIKLEVTRLKEDISNQKHKNDELRTKNRSVMTALNSTEEEYRTKANEFNEYKNSIEEEHRRTRECLARLYPNIKVDSSIDQSSFLKQIEAQAAQVKTKEVIVEKVVEKVVEDKELKKLVDSLKKENETLKSKVTTLEKESQVVQSTSTDDSSTVSKLEEENKTLEEKVVHYQKVLSDTEGLLNSLQASVEGEEIAWKARLAENQLVVKQLNADKANLQTKIQQLEKTLDKVKQAEELQDTLQQLREQLHQEETEKSNLQEQLIQAQEKLANTAAQGLGDADKVSKLEEENSKLRALVNVGQDSNRQQEQLITQLQQELSTCKSSGSNGIAVEQSADGGAAF